MSDLWDSWLPGHLGRFLEGLDPCWNALVHVVDGLASVLRSGHVGSGGTRSEMKLWRRGTL